MGFLSFTFDDGVFQLRLDFSHWRPAGRPVKKKKHHHQQQPQPIPLRPVLAKGPPPLPPPFALPPMRVATPFALLVNAPALKSDDVMRRYSSVEVERSDATLLDEDMTVAPPPPPPAREKTNDEQQRRDVRRALRETVDG